MNAGGGRETVYANMSATQDGCVLTVYKLDEGFPEENQYLLLPSGQPGTPPSQPVEVPGSPTSWNVTVEASGKLTAK